MRRSHVLLLALLFSLSSAFVVRQPLHGRSFRSGLTKAAPFAPLKAKGDGTGECPFSTPLGKIGTAGIISNIVCDYSLFVLKTTGSGLPAGFFGLEGAAEGISYLVVAGVFGWSLVTKIRTGSGLDAGPLGLLGAAEGLSFLTYEIRPMIYALSNILIDMTKINTLLHAVSIIDFDFPVKITSDSMDTKSDENFAHLILIF